MKGVEQEKAFRRWGSPLRLFLAGLGLNLCYLLILLSCDPSRENLFPPTASSPTVWEHSDMGTYVRSARAFLATGVFAGNDGQPDCHRTVGYPALLAFAMTTGGSWWVQWTWILQAAMAAAIYPALAYLAREWFGATHRQIGLLLLVYTLIGAGGVYSPILLTDQSFAACLWGSLALGTKAVRRGGIAGWLGHFFLLGAAASIRPTLALFPFAFSALMLALRRTGPESSPKPAWIQLFAAVFAIQMVLCQAPAMRNYVHYGLWIPSDVVVNNLSDYLAKDVLIVTGELDAKSSIDDAWKDLPLRERLGIQTEFARSVFAAHPFIAAGLAVINLGMNTVETHWIQTMHLFRSSLFSDLKRWSALPPSLKVFHSLWALVHAGLALAAGCGIWRLVRDRRWAFLLFIGVFLLPYLYGATDAQGARFRLYVEGLVLMLAFCVCSGSRCWKQGHGS